jgi:hypothetical protein
MKVWIRRFRSLFMHPRPDTVSASAPPITDLDLLRALGCDV